MKTKLITIFVLLTTPALTPAFASQLVTKGYQIFYHSWGSGTLNTTQVSYSKENDSCSITTEYVSAGNRRFNSSHLNANDDRCQLLKAAQVVREQMGGCVQREMILENTYNSGNSKKVSLVRTTECACVEELREWKSGTVNRVHTIHVNEVCVTRGL